MTLSATDYLRGLDRLAVFRAAMLDTMADWDVIATPSSPALPWPRTSPYPSPIAGQIVLPRTAATFSTAINLAGLPAIVVPAAVPSDSLPVGLQLIGAIDAEDLLLDLAEQFERAFPGGRSHRWRPRQCEQSSRPPRCAPGVRYRCCGSEMPTCPTLASTPALPARSSTQPPHERKSGESSGHGR
jgi:hypothetical protein